MEKGPVLDSPKLSLQNKELVMSGTLSKTISVAVSAGGEPEAHEMWPENWVPFATSGWAEEIGIMRFGKLTCKRSAEAQGTMLLGRAMVNAAKDRREKSMM
jgi:hypothetical protein